MNLKKNIDSVRVEIKSEYNDIETPVKKKNHPIP